MASRPTSAGSFVDEFLAPDERVELLEEVILPMSLIGERHSQLLHEGVIPNWFVRESGDLVGLIR